MIPSMTLKVSSKVSSALRRVIDAISPEAQQRNFETVMEFALREVRSHTPGDVLVGGWRKETKVTRSADGWSFSGKIYNIHIRTKLFYLAAISGEKKPKLDANDKQQTYGDILPILDKGSRPHEIRPRRYKNLVFRTSASPPAGSSDHSNLVITKKVHHPGTKAYGTLSIPRAKLRRLCSATVVKTREQVIKAW